MNTTIIGNEESLKEKVESCSKDSEYQQTANRGLTCPRCNTGVMEINSMMNLVCPECEYILGGGFT